MTHSHAALRRGRRSLPGHAYLVTSTTAGRRRLFAHAEVALAAAATLALPANWERSRSLAWVLMPDHWHALFVLGEGDTLARRVGWLKAESARALSRRFPALGPVWGPGYHDRAVRRDEDLRAAARYVVMNPVRAGLVERIGDYPFWDAAWLGQEPGAIL
ncbi:MAG: REP-associated tyrosine transposase [Lysobacteraceae bacterium]